MGTRTTPATRVDDTSARDRILAVAEQLFADQGYDRTSTARIASAAQVPQGLIFYHFKTKLDLLLAIVRDREITALDAELARIRPADDARAAVGQLWARLVRVLGRPSNLRRIVMQELNTHEQVRERAVALQDQLADSVAQHLARLTGAPQPAEPAYVAAARLLCMYAGMAPLLGPKIATRLRPDEVADLVVGGLPG